MNKTFVAILTGVAIGILIAPAKGSETRKKLVTRFNDLTEDLSDDADQLYASGKNLVDTVRADAKGLSSSFKNISEPIE